MRYQTVSEIY